MTKITLNDQSSLTNETTFLTSLNANWATIENASDTFLSRDGTAPNQMTADIDMNSHRVLNLLDAQTEQEPVTLNQFHVFQQATLGDIQATLDFVFGSTPNLFMVRGDTTWGSRAIVGDDLPTPTTQSLGGVLALSPTLGQVIGGLDVNGNLVAASQINLTSSSINALTVGRQGITQPAFQVNSGQVNQVTGIAITGQAAGNGVDISATGEANVPLRINSAGTGTTSINATGTGIVIIGSQSAGANTLFIANNTTPTINFGSSGNVQGLIKSTGTGGFQFGNESTGRFLDIIPSSSTSDNTFVIRPNSTTNQPLLDVLSVSQTDLGMNIRVKGNGQHTFSSTTSTAIFQTLVNATGGTNDRWILIQPGNSGGSTTQPNITFGGAQAATAQLNMPKTATVSSDASAFTVVKTVGLGTPAFRVDTSTASAITGIKITSLATGGGVNIDSIGDASTNVVFNAAGGGAITLQSTGTGGVTIGGAAGSQILTMGHTAPRIDFGTSGNVPVALRHFGSGGLTMTNNAGETTFQVTPNAASGIVARLNLTAVSAGGPSVVAAGTAADINLSLAAKGAGAVLFATGAGSNQASVRNIGDGTRIVQIDGGSTGGGTNATISVNAGSLGFGSAVVSTAGSTWAGAVSGTGAFTANSGTAIPAGGTAGTGFNFSSTANFGITFGSGAPTHSTAKGSLYLRSDGSTTNNRAYINTDGGTTWTAITTVA